MRWPSDVLVLQPKPGRWRAIERMILRRPTPASMACADTTGLSQAIPPFVSAPGNSSRTEPQTPAESHMSSVRRSKRSCTSRRGRQKSSGPPLRPNTCVVPPTLCAVQFFRCRAVSHRHTSGVKRIQSWRILLSRRAEKNELEATMNSGNLGRLRKAGFLSQL